MVTTCVGFELARCTIINYEEEVIFDQFFKPPNPVLNYNTEFSGITKSILDPVTNTIPDTLHPFLSQHITQDTILVGHSLENDFNAMQFYHTKVVDTSVLFQRKNGSKMKLKNLADKILNVQFDSTTQRKIQTSTHDSKEDCLATLHLVQARLENDHLLNVQKDYHLLRDLVNAKHGVLVVDHDIDNVNILINSAPTVQQRSFLKSCPL
jgi:RNA exonuclease 1